MPVVTDPAILAQLNGGGAPSPANMRPVTDPALLAQLNGTAPDTSGAVPQALSGVNEGLANFLSLPNDVELGLRSIGPRIVNALGGHAEIPTQSILPDAGQAYRNLANSMNAIKPTTTDPVGQFSRRVGQELGSNLVPSLGVEAKVASLLASLGSGAGAATAQLIAPGNQGAELVGEMAGGLGPVGVVNTLERRGLQTVAPSVDALKARAGALYDAAEARGTTFPQPAVKQIADAVTARALSDGIDPTLHPGAVAALQRLGAAANTGMTVGDAQTMRRVIAAATKDATNPDQTRIAGRMLDQFDQFVGGAAPELSAAREVYHQAKKGEMIDQAIELAGSRAGQFSGSGYENALRTEFRALDRQIIKGQLKGLSDDEIAAIRRVANGGPVENILRYVGKLAPTGVVSLGASAGLPFAVGNAFGGPVVGSVASGATMAAGMAARHAATSMTTHNAEVVSALMRRGALPDIPIVTPGAAKVAQALLLGEAANQNAPRNAVADAVLRRTAQASSQ